MGYTSQWIKIIAKSLGKLIPDKQYLSIRYYITFKKRINWKKPKGFNEKLQYLKINYRDRELTNYVDKYEVRKHVKDVIGEEYLIKCIGVWDAYDKIEFNALPNEFVLKCTHDSGSVVICSDKRTFDFNHAKSKLEECLKNDNFYGGREWPYKNVKPRIIAEELIKSDDGDLKDYKFFCFNGKVKCFKVDFDRATDHHANYYDIEGKILPFGEKYFPPDKSKKIEIPNNLKDMEELAEKLAHGIPFVRIDFYDVDEKIYFGEMTFFPACGFEAFEPNEWDLKLGNWLDLSEIEDKK